MSYNWFDGYKAKKLEITEDFKTIGLRIPTGTPVNAVSASGKYTITASNVANEDEVTIGDITYTFVTNLTEADGESEPVLYEVKIGDTNVDSAANLVAAIMGDKDGEGTVFGTGTVAHPLVTAEAGEGADTDNIITVTAKTKGATGNSIALDTTATNGSWSDTDPYDEEHLAGGVNGTVASAAGVWFADESNIYLTIGANTVSGTNWRKIALSSL